MTEYSERFDDDGEQLLCECCNYPAALAAIRQPPNKYGIEEMTLCEVCASTKLSRHLTWPLPERDGDLYQSVGYIANMVLDEIRKVTK